MNRFNIACGIDTTFDVDNSFIFKATDHLNYSISLANVGEKLITEAFALGRAANQAGDIDEFHRRGHDHVGLDDLGQRLEPFVRDGDDANIRLYRGERIIGRQRGFLGGQCVEKCRFTYVGQANDTSLKHNLRV